MQQFIFLPLATYTAQMVFAKTFSHRNTSGAIRKSSELFRGSQTKFSCCNRDRGRPPSGSLFLPALNQTWNSGLCQTLIPSPCTLDKMIALKYENICVTGERQRRWNGRGCNGRNSRSFETVWSGGAWEKLHWGKVNETVGEITEVCSSAVNGDSSCPSGELRCRPLKCKGQRRLFEFAESEIVFSIFVHFKVLLVYSYVSHDMSCEQVSSSHTKTYL